MVDKRTLASEFASRIKKRNPLIQKVFLFGSVASGTDKKDSDVDILVVTKGDRRRVTDKVMDDVVETLLKRSVYVSAKVISEKEYGLLKNTHFISEINKKGVIIG